MKFLSPLSLTLFLLSPFSVIASNDCQPATWAQGALRRAAATGTVIAFSNSSASVANVGDVQPDQINCRYWGSTYSDVNYYTCTQLADKYDITVELFFQLNPTLTLDCGNIQPNTDYCVDGFIEPLRASNGLCGPPNQNSTCLGTALQCCNAQTWTCGNSTADCAPGTCYEGACVGDNVYSTDGTCGYQHGNRLCAGRWGDCCNMNGTCGTGSTFCGINSCQSGNCTSASSTPPTTGPTYLAGNTTDGTCGGANYYTCNVVFGNCCNKDGLCGSLPSDCGVGCQPQFGSCSSSTIISSSSSRSSTTSLSTKSTSSTTITFSTTKSTSTSTSASSTTSSTTKSTSTSTSASSTTSSTTKSTSTSTSASSTTSSTTKSTSTSTSASSTTSSTTKSTSTSTSASSTTSSTTKSTSTSKSASSTTTGLASLPPCGQTCFNNMLGQYSSLGCATPDPYCLCSNVNFGYGIRDCSNGACGTAVAGTIIAYGSAYCSSASATHTSTATGVAALPSCGQTCFNNMLGQYSSLGCASPDPKCLCSNVNFGYGIRDCSNAACGTAVASTVIAYGSSYCASATAAPIVR